MKTLCHYFEFEDKKLKNLRSLFQEKEDWIQELILNESIQEIFFKICFKELVLSPITTYKFLMKQLDTEWEIQESTKVEDMQEIRNTTMDISEVITEIEGNMKGRVVDVPCEKTESVDIHEKQELCYGTFSIMNSEDLFLDIITNIGYSIKCWNNQDEYCFLSDESIDFIDNWMKYKKKGRDKVKNNTNKENNDNKANKENDANDINHKKKNTYNFIDVTKNQLPITCKVRIKRKCMPQIQNVIPNLFRGFVIMPQWTNMYQKGVLRNYDREAIQKIYTLYNYDIFEKYVLEEIIGMQLATTLYELFSKEFKNIGVDTINNKVNKEINIFIMQLLKWKGQYTRIYFIKKLMSMNLFTIKDEIDGCLLRTEQDILYIKKVILSYSEILQVLMKQGIPLYDKLYKELLYILWKKFNGDLQKIQTVCEDIIIGKNRKDNDVIISKKEIYQEIQKKIMINILKNKTP